MIWMMGQPIDESPLLVGHSFSTNIRKRKSWSRSLVFFIGLIVITIIGLQQRGNLISWVLGRRERSNNGGNQIGDSGIIESDQAVVAADDGRCSAIGVSVLRRGGHAVDAAVATALCLGVVNPMASGIGGGGFMVVRSSSTLEAQAFDFRETAPLAASQDMYQKNIKDKYVGPLAAGVPGEIAGLHEAWLRHGRLPWSLLFEPAIKLATDGYIIAPYLASSMAKSAKAILTDPGLKKVFAPNGKLLTAGDLCYNVELGQSLQMIAEGPQSFYNGSLGRRLVKDVREAGGVLTMEDLRSYKVNVMDAMAVNAMGYTIFGMPPPSSGTLGISMVMKIFESYGKSDANKGDLGLHRLIEALKHMFAKRMSLGDPSFVNIDQTIEDMLSPSFAAEIREKILDNTTFPPDHYMYRWNQLRDHGTSHFCIVDADRNAVSMTTTVNYPFGGGFMSPSTGIVLNDEMGDFSTPTEVYPDMLPPAPANFIEPKKRPLSSMVPIIVTKDDQLVGVIGGSGGMNIIPAVTQVFLNHFVLGFEPLVAVQSPRIYHKLIPNVVVYENWTVIDGDHIELSEESKAFLEERGHQLTGKAGGAIVQLVVQTIKDPIETTNRENGNTVIHGTLTAVSDPRKDGKPAAI